MGCVVFPETALENAPLPEKAPATFVVQLDISDATFVEVSKA